MASVESERLFASKAILTRLREDLQSFDAPIPSEMKLKGDLYTRCHQVYLEVTGHSMEVFCSYLSEQICNELRKQPTGQESVNVCSVGCGNGEADYKVLSNVYQVFPAAVVNYAGIDINDVSCARAKELLSSLPPSCKTSILNESILEMNAKSLFKCDIVIMAHVHYWFSDTLSALFTKALELCQPQTGRVEVISANYVSLWQMEEIFMKHKGFAGYTLLYSHLLLEKLESLGLNYTAKELPAEAHCGALFGPDSSQSNEADAEALLTFLCQTNLAAYPPPIVSLCAEYVKGCLDQEGQTHCSCTAVTLQPAAHE